MIRYAINSENKTIELLSGGSISELKDLCKKYKDYSFSVSFSRENLKQGISVGSVYIHLIPQIEHN